MLYIDSLTLKGIRSFKDEVTIHFPQTGSTLIQGIHIDSKTTSGVGKSSIILAMNWLLGLTSLPSTQLKNWESDSMYASMTLRSGDQVYKIVRDPKLSFYTNDVKYDGLATGAEEEIAKMLGLNKDLAEILTYRAQRTKGKFVHFTDLEKKEFLTNCLNLHELEQANDELSTKLKSLQSSRESLDYEINFLTEQLKKYEDGLEDKHHVATINYNTAKSDYELASKSTPEELISQLKRADDHIKNIEYAQSNIDKLGYRNSTIQRDMTSLLAQIEKLMEGVCPLCKQQWVSESQQQKLESDKESYISYTNEIEQNKIKIEQLGPFILSKDQAKQSYVELASKINSYKQNSHSLQTIMSQAKNLLDSVTRDIAQREASNKKLTETSSSKAAIVDELEFTDLAMKLIGRSGFLGEIFGEILIEVEQYANDFLIRSPNTNNIGVKFSLDQVSKKGAVQKKINLSLLRDGKEVAFAAVSGGQQCAIELCIDLAVSLVIRKRMDNRLGWLILDEALDSLDLLCKQSILELLREKVTGQIIVIDHMTEIKESFTQVINISYDGTTSRVE